MFQARIPIFIVLALVMGSIGCTTTEKIKSGAMAYEFRQYHLASQLLKEELNQNLPQSQKARKAFLIAESASKYNNVEEALEWYMRSYEWGYGPSALFKYALQLKRKERYAESLKVLQQLVQNQPDRVEFREELIAIRQVIDWYERDRLENVKIDRPVWNSPHSDFNPVLSPEGKLLFTSDRRDNTGEELYQWTGQKYTDVYEANLNQPQSKALKTKLPINTDAHEGSPGFHPSGNEMVFVRCGNSEGQYDQYCLLYHSVKVDGRWSQVNVLPFVEEEVNYRHPRFNGDGSRLFFAADGPEGFGGYDLWEVSYGEGGSWGTPQNLGSRLNTEGNELFPSFHEDSLYFSSDGRVGFGGLDIYKSHFDDQLGWLPPQHLPYPLNSGGDDMSFLPLSPLEEGQRRALLASSRGAAGGDDLLMISYEEAVTPEKSDDDSLELEVIVRGEVYRQKDDPNSGVATTVPLENANLKIIQGGEVRTETTNRVGTYRGMLIPETEILVMASHSGHLNRSITKSPFQQEREMENGKLTLEIVLPQEVIDREITVQNIYYDFDKANIRSDAARVLDSLAQLFMDNPSFQIEMGSHTDCRGEEDYNRELSQKRAESAVQYLIKKGVRSDRLSARGYGESKPAVDCECDLCSEEEHQQNRRTTFRLRKGES